MWIDIHTHRVENQQNVFEILNKFPEDEILPNEYFSVGIHPQQITENWQYQMNLVQEKAMDDNCLAIGECGLDRLSQTPLDVQQKVFIQQLQLAETLQKPVIIHCVRAYQELMQIHQTEKPTVPLVIHGYPKGLTLAKQLVQKGFYLSFGKLLLHSPKLQEAFVNTPADKIFLETDGADTAIKKIYDQSAALKNTCLKNQLKNNVNRVFQLNLQPILKK